MAPEVSVLMAVHNTGAHIARAVQSILDQTFTDFEFLIIDDGSTDNSMRVVKEAADARIRIVANRKNIGLTRSLNRGLALAQGRFIARMDGDDISYPTRLEKQTAFLKGHPACGLVGTGYLTVDEHGYPLNQGRVIAADLDLKEALKVTNQFAHSSVMFPKKVIAAVDGYREVFHFAQDYDLFLRISEKFAIALLPEILLERRIGLDAVSVKDKILQDRFAQMARECARQRSANGSDFVSGSGREKSASAFLNTVVLHPSAREKRSLAAESYFAWALYFKNHRNGYAHRTGYVLKLLKRSLLADPRVFIGLACGRMIRLAGRLVFRKKKKN